MDRDRPPGGHHQGNQVPAGIAGAGDAPRPGRGRTGLSAAALTAGFPGQSPASAATPASVSVAAPSGPWPLASTRLQSLHRSPVRIVGPTALRAARPDPAES